MAGAKPPTDTEFADWVRAPSAFAYAKAQFKGEWAAHDAILRSLEIGDMLAVARLMDRGVIPGAGEVHDMWPIPRSDWSKMSLTIHSEFWKNGGATYAEDSGRGLLPVSRRLLDVRFDPEGFARLVPPDSRALSSQPAAEPVPTPKHPGGRPRADHWEDLLIEIARQLYAGELIPKKQADIENAMADWIEANNANAGPTTIRERAAKLWRLIKD